ncbi:hypothetical protein NPS46_20570 [Pseudomonas putida]|uniref:hypothetical protein n=1 Tax=Pseudomonas putida TaxID=303 RepID=UPI00236361AE|nr:hypothetical protein [Pseudomonas putida]MDD2054946.1 hypothetical protein [Pseudomonas putida]
MADYTELKRLAETANAVTSDTRVEMTISSEPGPNQAEIDAVTAFMGAATPAAVLALIAENNRLNTLRSKTERELEQELEVWRNGPSCWSCGDTGDVHDILGEWRGQCDCNAAKLIDVSSERDQLKAENESLRKALGDCADELSAEVICKHGGQKLEDMHPVTRRLYERDMASVIVARAAMGKEEQS